MSRFSGPQPHESAWAAGRNKGALAWHRERLRLDAENRNAVTLPRNRSTRARARRPKGTPPAVAETLPTPPPDAPVIECPWPWKDAHPDKAAARRKLAWLRSRDDKDFRTAEAYRCPGPDDHWHLGNPAVPAERSRKERYRRDEEAA